MTAPGSELFVSCGEASGDVYASELIAELSKRRPDLKAFGLGGARAQAVGLDAVATLDDVSVIGLVEVVGKLPALSRTMRKLVVACRERRPTAAVLIDFSGFHLRLAKKLKALGIPIIYYVSPQIWAWRAGRIRAIQALVDEMLVILPFERVIYEEAQVPVKFVGHPLVDLVRRTEAREGFCERHGLDPERPYIMMLPGSRRREVELHLPSFSAAVDHLSRSHADLQFVLSQAETVSMALVRDILGASASRITLLEGSPYDGLSYASASVVASGTATVEAAILESPMVVVYRAGALSYALGRRFVDVPFFSMVNLIAERALVPELEQHEVTGENIAAHIARLLEGDNADRQREGLRAVKKALGGGGASGRAAEAVLRHFALS